MKKSIVSIFSLVMLLTLAACNEQSSSTNNSNTSGNTTNLITETNITSSNTLTNSQADNDDMIHEEVVDVDFGSLKKTADDLGTETEGGTAALNNLKAVINKDLLDPIVDDITCEGKVQIHGHQMTSNKHDPYYNYLIIGGKKLDYEGNPVCDGAITFVFSKNIKEITFKCKGFHKYNFTTEPGVKQEMMYDQNVYADVLVNEELKLDNVKINECKTFEDPQTLITLNLDNPSNVFTLKTHENKQYNRFFLEGLTLTYDEQITY